MRREIREAIITMFRKNVRRIAIPMFNLILFRARIRALGKEEAKTWLSTLLPLIL